MRTLMAVAAAGLTVVGIGVWLNAASQSSTTSSVSPDMLTPSISLSKATTKTPAISIWEIHNQAYMDNLPVDDFEDQAMAFTTARR
jgi:hypothetical protein